MTNTNIIRYKDNEHTSSSNKLSPQIPFLDNISQLSLNEPYTYKQLCEILDQPYKSSNSKTRQLLEWSRFFKYKKIGTKYFITEIYSDPAPYLPLSSTASTHQKYINNVVDIILSYIYTSGQQIFYFTYLELIIICGLANQLYEKYFKSTALLGKEFSFPVSDINDFYTRSYLKMKDVLKTALDSMQNRSILQYIPTYIIVFRTSNNSNKYEYREATDQEQNIITEIRYKALHDLNLKEMNELWYRPQHIRQQFYDLFQKYITEYNPYWMKVYKTTKILAPYPIVQKEANITSIKQSLNIKMFNFLNDQAIKESAKHIAPGQDPGSTEWVKAQKVLSEKLIKLFDGIDFNTLDNNENLC